jgi:hypothetical protein
VDSLERGCEDLPEPAGDEPNELAFLGDKNVSELTRVPPRCRLYSSMSVGLATFVGSPASGGLIMAINYWRLGQSLAAAVIFALGVAATATLAVMCVLFSLENNDLKMAWPLAGVGVFCVAGTASAVAEMLQGKTLRRHAMLAGKLASPWSALAIGVVLTSAVCLIGWRVIERIREPLDLYAAGSAAAGEGDIERADSLFSRAILLQPDFGKAYLQRGIVRSRRKQMALAAEDLDKAVELLPGQETALIERARNKLLLDKNEDAVADLSRALRSVSSAEAFYLRAQGNLRCGRIGEAAIDCSLALKMELRPEFLRLRADCYDATGEHGKAAFDRSSADSLETGSQ